MADFAAERARMVERQLRGRGISDERVLAAMGEVPREQFVAEADRRRAYTDGALGIGEGQTISQPWIVAAITQALELKGGELVLEVGTGSGYSAAVLAGLAGSVISLERHESLATAARARLAELGVANVRVLVADGSLGLPEHAPYGAIAVHAAVPAPPPALIAQLAEGAILVAPVACGRTGEVLSAFRRGPQGTLDSREIAPARFVPLIGEQGFGEPAAIE